MMSQGFFELFFDPVNLLVGVVVVVGTVLFLRTKRFQRWLNRISSGN